MAPRGRSGSAAAKSKSVLPHDASAIVSSAPSAADESRSNATPAPAVTRSSEKSREDRDDITAAAIIPLALFSALAYGYWWLYRNTARTDWFTGQSAWTPAVVCLAYLAFVFSGRAIMAGRAPLPIKNVMLVYNVYQTCSNFANVAGFVYALIQTGSTLWGRELRVGADFDAASYDFSFWIWVHYTNKYIELLDTVFMIARNKFDQVSFLHVYHHVLLILAWYLVVSYACGGDAYFGALANSCIHVVMYSYYSMALLKIAVPWKRYITQLQMVQFAVCLTHAVYVAYFNIYPRWLGAVQIWVMVNMLVLFGNFYSEQYAEKKVRWTIIEGRKYNLSEFVKRHPGGSDMLMLAVGRDASAMFHTYHRRLDTARAALAKLPVIEGDIDPKLDGSRLEGPASCDPPASVGTLGFHKRLDGPLYRTLRARVNEYFATHGIPSRGGMIIKSVALVAVTALTYYMCVFSGLFYLAPLLGVLVAVNGFAIQHDANHGAFHPSAVVNRIAGMVNDVIGGSALMWRHQHNVAHHIHPNDRNLDADTYSSFPILRMNPDMPHRPIQRFQHLYFPFLYGFIGFAYLFGDFQAFVTGHYYHVRLQPLRFMDKVIFVLGKLLHLGLMVATPVYLHGWWAVLTFYFVMEWFGGLYLATCFAVSHNAESTHHNVSDKKEWAEMQILTSANWSPDSAFWLNAVGGLNFQIEHHLFPSVAHIHYPALARIVKQVCKEHNVPYNSHDSFGSLLMSHVRALYRLGHNDEKRD